MDLLYGLWFGFWNGLDDMFYGLEKMQIAEMKIFNFSCSFLFYFFCAKGLNFFKKNSSYDSRLYVYKTQSSPPLRQTYFCQSKPRHPIPKLVYVIYLEEFK